MPCTPCPRPSGLVSRTVCLFVMLAAATSPGGEPSRGEVAGLHARWYADYAQAMQVAKADGRMMFVFFYEPGSSRLRDHFQSAILDSPAVREGLRDYVRVKLPLDVKIHHPDKELTLIEHPCFKKMDGRQGVAMIDFAHRDAEYYGWVVSTFPFTPTHCYSVRQMKIILDLPPGTPKERWRVYERRASGKEIARKEPPPVHWHTDYAQAVEEARWRERMLLICFCDCEKDPLCRRFHAETLEAPLVRKKLQDYVCARLPLQATIHLEGKQETVLKHPAFAEMSGRPGVAILDFAHKQSKHYGRVVSIFPLSSRLWYTPEKMAVILDLPPGSLTQRTLIYAVRTHPDKPASTDGQIDEHLMEEAEKHSLYQARIRRQGHHFWNIRFRRISARLPGGLTASEVCAESWPGEGLVEGALECVRSWRFSSGHWSAVRARHQVYGYDMKRGVDGVWYATGIFGRR